MMSASATNSALAYRDIYEQYLDEAAFLWVLRSIAVKQPHYTAADIKELEQRIAANLDGLMTSVDLAWEISAEALLLEQAGEVFVAAVIAFTSGNAERIQKAVEAGLMSDETFKGLVSALGWLPGELCHSWVKQFLNSKDINHKYLALAVCGARGEDPAAYLNKILQRDDCLEHEKLYATAVRLIGEFKRQDLVVALNTAIASDNEDVAFWANWSAILLGNHAAIDALEPMVLQAGGYQSKAIQLVFRVLPIERAREWVSKLTADKEQARTVIKAVGVLGDPHAVSWLITQMRIPGLSRLAGESFTMLTGIDLEKQEMLIEPPEEDEQQPSDDADDEDVSMDEDEYLPWPDVEKITAAWQRYGSNFIAGKRYFMGRPINAELLQDKLVNGGQRQRMAAAMELAVLNTSQKLPNVKAKVL